MPRYEFECSDCGVQFSVFVTYSKKKDTTCPECESDDLKENYGLAIGGGGRSGGSRSSGSSRPRFT